MSAARKARRFRADEEVLGGATQGDVDDSFVALVFAVMLLATANTSFAQPRSRSGGSSLMCAAASAGLPTATGLDAVLPDSTVVPSRRLGLDVGAHVYVFRLGAVALGVGATWLMARGIHRRRRNSADGHDAPAAETIPEVTTRLTSLAPQVSLNFGHSARVELCERGTRARPRSRARRRPSSRCNTMFHATGFRMDEDDQLRRRRALVHQRSLGVGFDLRWHNLATVPASATHPGAPRVAADRGVGVVVK